MPTTYDDCTDDVIDMADAIMRKHYQDLIEANVNIKYLFHVNAEGVPLKHKGWPAAATVQVNNLKKRRAGAAHVVITIDQFWWTQHDQAQCRAVLDHELYHVTVAIDDDGTVITEDDGSPKVRLRPHDFEIGGFHDIVERHRLAASEALAVAECSRKWVQFGLFSGDDMRPDAGGEDYKMEISTPGSETVTFTGKQLAELKEKMKSKGEAQ